MSTFHPKRTLAACLFLTHSPFSCVFVPHPKRRVLTLDIFETRTAVVNNSSRAETDSADRDIGADEEQL